MKHLLFITFCFCISSAVFSQKSSKPDIRPDYIKNEGFPDFTVYTAPDSTAFTNEDLKKKKPTLLMIFSPECGHCQNVTTELTKNMDHFKKAQILMVTWLPYNEMINFYHTYQIGQYPEITMGWDKKDFFLPYYQVQMYPKLVVYNKNGKYVNSFSGEINLEDVWKALED